MNPTPRRVAVPVLAGMGNALMAQPLVRQLAAAFPGADLRVFARNNSIAGVFQRLACVGGADAFGNQPRQFARLLVALRRFRADLLVVPYPSNRWQYSLLARLAGARRVVMHGYAAGRLGALHPLVGGRVPSGPGRHDVLTNLDLLAPLDISADTSMAPVFPLEPAERDAARLRLETVAGPGRYAAIHGGSGQTVFALAKRWPTHGWADVVPHLRSRGLVPVAVEGPEDAGVGDELHAQAGLPVLRLGGTLADAAAVLAACDLYVGSDSGLAHLAAAVATPPVTLFGPARPDEVSPWTYRHLAVATPAACAPCFDYPHHRTTPHVRCRVPYCIGLISPQRVNAAVDDALTAQSSNNATTPTTPTTPAGSTGPPRGAPPSP